MSISRLLISAGNVSLAWNLLSADFNQSRSVGVTPTDLSFKTDGLKMYVFLVGGVREYDLSTAWDISTASYLQGGSLINNSRGSFFKPDGLKIYRSNIVDDLLYEYDLSTAWDVSTTSLNQTLDISGQTGIVTGIFFKPDGSKMYLLDDTSPNAVYEYDLSTAWDISTASYLQNFSVDAQDITSNALYFRSDGLKMYVAGGFGQDINEYNLSTAWDISTASYLQNFSVSAQDTPVGLFFKPDGLKMYVAGEDNNAVYEYDLG